MLDFFRNIFSSSDLSDINSKDVGNDKEIDKIVKKHFSKKKPWEAALEKVSKGMEQHKERRLDNRDAKDETFGSTTTEDIAKSRRGSVHKWVYKAIGMTFIMIFITAFWQVVSSDTPRPTTQKTHEKELDGIQIEDADYFQSRIGAQMASIAGELERIKTESKEKDAAAREALLVEADKSKKLQEEIDALKLKEKEAKKENTDQTVIAMVNEKLNEFKQMMDAKDKRPSPSEASHKIMPFPSSGTDNILIGGSDDVAGNTDYNLTDTEKEEVKQKVEEGVKALAHEQTYENVTIESIAIDSTIQDNSMDKKEKQPPLHIMTGFAKAVLITGVDAPTFSAGKSNPVPVILSLTSNQIIANGFDANINDCMLIAQAHGNMNTRRAIIEVTRMSCNVEKDGEMFKIEKEVKGWVYDENGVHGLVGRLVDSSGKIITGEMAIGFAQGVATAFAQPNTTIQNVGGVPSQLFTETNGEQAVYRGMAEGTNNALNGLADYYKKLLDGAYPFISVRSGREVTVLFKGGESMELQPYTRVDVDSYSSSVSEETMEIDENEW